MRVPLLPTLSSIAALPPGLSGGFAGTRLQERSDEAGWKPLDQRTIAHPPCLPGPSHGPGSAQRRAPFLSPAKRAGGAQ